LDHVNIETHGDLGIPHDSRYAHMKTLKVDINTWPQPSVLHAGNLGGAASALALKGQAKSGI